MSKADLAKCLQKAFDVREDESNLVLPSSLKGTKRDDRPQVCC